MSGGCTGFYGSLEIHHRHISWSLLSLLGSKSNSSWLSIDDFNEVMFLNEKKSGNDRAEWQID